MIVVWLWWVTWHGTNMVMAHSKSLDSVNNFSLVDACQISIHTFHLNCIERVLTRKAAMESFWNYHVEEELRERSLFAMTKFHRDSDRENVMREIESLRRNDAYKHHYCDENCRKRG